MMRAHELEDGLVATCHACRSLWLDNAASQRVAAGRLSHSAFVAMQNATPVAEVADGYRVAAPRAGAERRCPICDVGLHQVEVASERVVLDVCPIHGTYFDPQELQTIHREAVHRNALDEGEARAFAEKLARTRAEYFAQLGGAPDQDTETFLEAIVRVLFSRR